MFKPNEGDVPERKCSEKSEQTNCNELLKRQLKLHRKIFREEVGQITGHRLSFR
jgi:hypothetical protein